MPDLIMASAMPRIISSLTLQPNLFHEFHPMGGVRATAGEGTLFSCANEPATSRQPPRNKIKVDLCAFMLPPRFSTRSGFRVARVRDQTLHAGGSSVRRPAPSAASHT